MVLLIIKKLLQTGLKFSTLIDGYTPILKLSRWIVEDEELKEDWDVRGVAALGSRYYQGWDWSRICLHHQEENWC